MTNEDNKLIDLRSKVFEPVGLEPAYRLQYEGENEGGSQTLQDYLRIVWGRKFLVAALSLLGGLIGASTILPQTPSYRARTSIEIQGRKDNLSLRAVSGMGDASDVYLQTQVRILQSETLVGSVVKELTESAPSEVTQQPSAWQRLLSSMGFPTTPTTLPLNQVLPNMALSLRLSTPELTRIIEITAEAPDAKLAADFVNTLVSKFTQHNLESRWNNAQQTSAFLNRQLEDLQAKITSSEGRLQTYAKDSGLVLATESKTVSEEKLSQLQRELSNAQVERVTRQSRYELAKSQPVETLPDLYSSGPLGTYITRLTELRREYAEASSAFTPQHPRVQRVQAQIDVLEAAIRQEGSNILARLRNDYEASVQREKLLEDAYSAQAEVVGHLNDDSNRYEVLKREIDADRQLYSTLLQQVKEIGIASAMDVSNVWVVDPATVRTRPYRPDVYQASAMGLVIGTVFGIVVVLALERLDTRLRYPGKALTALRMQELGAIPQAKVALGKHHRLKLSKSNRGAGSVELATWQNKDSLLAESFRATVASILFAHSNGHAPAVIVVASPHANEGKTMTVTNLGIAIAEIGRPVLLIDADTHSPRLHKIFDVGNSWGMSDLLREHIPVSEYPIEAIARPTKVPNLYLLTSGTGTAVTSNLLHSARMIQLVSRLRESFPNVLIDTPPTLQFSEARVLGRMADGVVLVFRAAKTQRETANAVRQRFEEDRTCVVGCILNDWNPKRMPGYMRNYYYQ